MSTSAVSSFRDTVVDIGSVLIVEPNEALGTLLAEVIRTWTPYRPVLVSNPFQALSIARESKPILFLLDNYLDPFLYLCGVNGAYLHDQLHVLKDLENVPTIVLTAYYSEYAELRKRGVIWLDKGFGIDRLLQTIEKTVIQVFDPLGRAA